MSSNAVDRGVASTIALIRRAAIGWARVGLLFICTTPVAPVRGV